MKFSIKHLFYLQLIAAIVLCPVLWWIDADATSRRDMRLRDYIHEHGGWVYYYERPLYWWVMGVDLRNSDYKINELHKLKELIYLLSLDLDDKYITSKTIGDLPRVTSLDLERVDLDEDEVNALIENSHKWKFLNLESCTLSPTHRKRLIESSKCEVYIYTRKTNY